jgi:hypothetical protein
MDATIQFRTNLLAPIYRKRKDSRKLNCLTSPQFQRSGIWTNLSLRITQATSNFMGDHQQKKVTIGKGVIMQLDWLWKRLKPSDQPVERLRFYRVLPKYRFIATSRKWVVRKGCLGAVCGSGPEPQLLTMKRPLATSQG